MAASYVGLKYAERRLAIHNGPPFMILTIKRTSATHVCDCDMSRYYRSRRAKRKRATATTGYTLQLLGNHT